MARAIWKGSIAFGLVQIPVSLTAAEEPRELSFDLLDRRDLAPVGYERVNKRTGRKVDWKNVVKGYEYRKGRYVVVTDRDFERANVEATHTIDIEQFVDPAEIDPRYYERPYYLLPDKKGEKAYVLLRDTLQRAGKGAVARSSSGPGSTWRSSCHEARRLRSCSCASTTSSRSRKSSIYPGAAPSSSA